MADKLLCGSRKCCLIVLFTVGSLLIIGGIVLFVFAPALVQNIVNKQVVLAPGSDSYNAWQNIPAATYMKFHVFDLTNAPNVTKIGSLPHVVEVGTLVYSEKLPRAGVVSNSNGTLTYHQPRIYYHEPTLSTVDINRTITTINIPLLTIAYKLRNLPPTLARIADEILKLFDGSLFIQKTIGEIIWGYEDPLLKRIAVVAKKLLNITIDYKIGLFAGRNGSDDGLFNVYTGAGDVQTLNTIFTWNYKLNLPYWNSEFANRINGTDGTLFQPGMSRYDRPYVFSTDICRSIYLAYVRPISTFDIDVMRFEIPTDALADHINVPSNGDFCTPPGNCLKAGALNVSVCRNGEPIVISLPHFYQADPAYQNAVSGLHPDPEAHSLYFDIEPLTGAVLNVSKRLQINVPLRQIRGLSDTLLLSNQTFLYPVAWLAETGQLDTDLADQFKRTVYTPRLILTIILPSVLITIGIASVIAAIGILTCGAMKKAEDRNLLIVNTDASGEALGSQPNASHDVANSESNAETEAEDAHNVLVSVDDDHPSNESH